MSIQLYYRDQCRNRENAASKMTQDYPRHIIFNGAFYTGVSVCSFMSRMQSNQPLPTTTNLKRGQEEEERFLIGLGTFTLNPCTSRPAGVCSLPLILGDFNQDLRHTHKTNTNLRPTRVASFVYLSHYSELRVQKVLPTRLYTYMIWGRNDEGSIFEGTLKGFDQTINLILDESHERVYSTTQGVEQVVLGLHIIRGDNVAVVGELDDNMDSRLDLSSIRAEPLNSVVH
ncbi:unnamed protein product [Timema podura]|uniref:U6 snRNA-associated Sm-like protein LSm8 n=1 Tax=Timema podura TaxID=61482 RepID=A0ABN7NTW8_TIMPD|nr:unnamed protein product [Timema podura]